MADDNKPLKYMRYAIGEIVLVVIGILIALQINTWNQNRINNKKLKNYLTELVIDLNYNAVVISIQLETLNNRNEIRKSFLALKDYNKLSVDSLEKSLETFYETVDFSRATFDKIENSGITDFGQYVSLIEDLRIYYNYVIPRAENQLATISRAVELEQSFWRYNQNLYEFSYDEELASAQSKDESKEQLIELLQSPTTRNILKIDYLRNKQLIKTFRGVNDGTVYFKEATEEAIKEQPE